MYTFTKLTENLIEVSNGIYKVNVYMEDDGISEIDVLDEDPRIDDYYHEIDSMELDIFILHTAAKVGAKLTKEYLLRSEDGLPPE